MTQVTASIFVELEIKVSGTHVKGCPESHNPPSPAEPAGWEDITVEGIAHTAMRYREGKMDRLPVDLFAPAPFRSNHIDRAFHDSDALRRFLANLTDEFSEDIEQALGDELPDGPDPDDARDAAIDRELMGYEP